MKIWIIEVDAMMSLKKHTFHNVLKIQFANTNKLSKSSLHDLPPAVRPTARSAVDVRSYIYKQYGSSYTRTRSPFIQNDVLGITAASCLSHLDRSDVICAV